MQAVNRPEANFIESSTQVDEVLLDLVGKPLKCFVFLVLDVLLLSSDLSAFCRSKSYRIFARFCAPLPHHRVQLLAAELDLRAGVTNDVVVAQRDEAHRPHRIDALDDPSDLPPVGLALS